MAQIMFSAGAGRFDQLRTAVEDAGITVPASIRSKQNLLEWLDTEGHTYSFENQVVTTSNKTLMLADGAGREIPYVISDHTEPKDESLNQVAFLNNIIVGESLQTDAGEFVQFSATLPNGEDRRFQASGSVGLAFLASYGIKSASEALKRYQDYIRGANLNTSIGAGFRAQMNADQKKELDDITNKGLESAVEEFAARRGGNPVYINVQGRSRVAGVSSFFMPLADANATNDEVAAQYGIAAGNVRKHRLDIVPNRLATGFSEVKRGEIYKGVILYHLRDGQNIQSVVLSSELAFNQKAKEYAGASELQSSFNMMRQFRDLNLNDADLIAMAKVRAALMGNVGALTGATADAK